MIDLGGLLSRWSRLKSASGARAKREILSDPELSTSEASAPASPSVGPAGAAPAADLPAIESLTKDSDYSAFLREGVPEDLKRAALRRLWVSDPVLANLDGLLEYGEDFAAPFRAAEVVNTVYQILQGMPGAEEKAAATGAEAAATPPAPASEPPVPPDLQPAESAMPHPATAGSNGSELNPPQVGIKKFTLTAKG